MSTRIIRKISIGSDYPHNSMHFEKGQQINNKRTGEPLFVITDIIKRGDFIYEIYILNNKGETMMWDRFENMPVVAQFEVYL